MGRVQNVPRIDLICSREMRPLFQVAERGIDAKHHHLIGGVARREILRDVTAVSRQRAGEARDDIVKWDVVIARHGELRKWNFIEIVRTAMN